MQANKLRKLVRKASRELLEDFALEMLEKMFADPETNEIDLDKELDSDFLGDAPNTAQELFGMSAFMDKERRKDEQAASLHDKYLHAGKKK